MKDIFEVDSSEFDPVLEDLFMNTAEGTTETSLSLFAENLRNGNSPEQSYRAAISIPDSSQSPYEGLSD